MALWCQRITPPLGHSPTLRPESQSRKQAAPGQFREIGTDPTLETRPFGVASCEQCLGGGLLGRASQELWPRGLGRFVLRLTYTVNSSEVSNEVRGALLRPTETPSHPGSWGRFRDQPPSRTDRFERIDPLVRIRVEHPRDGDSFAEMDADLP